MGAHLAEVDERGWWVTETATEEDFHALAARLGVVRPSRPGRGAIEQLAVVSTTDARRNTHSAKHGEGAFPFHSDTAHWKMPARYVLLRSASASRRPTWVLDLRNVVPDALRAALGEALFTVVNGRESFLTHGWERGRFRYNPTCMRPATKRAAAPWQAVHDVIAASSATPVYWERARTLVIDNWRCVHARGESPGEREPDRTLARILVEVAHDDGT